MFKEVNKARLMKITELKVECAKGTLEICCFEKPTNPEINKNLKLK